MLGQGLQGALILFPDKCLETQVSWGPQKPWGASSPFSPSSQKAEKVRGP